MDKSERAPEIRICNVSIDLHNDIQNIAKNSGVTIQQLLKPKLREIANSYSDAMKRPPRKD